MISIYEHSVGGNATFLLNIPPTKEGLFHENDVKRLHEIGEYQKKCYGKNLLEKASLFCEEQKKGFEIENLRMMIMIHILRHQMDKETAGFT